MFPEFQTSVSELAVWKVKSLVFVQQTVWPTLIVTVLGSKAKSTMSTPTSPAWQASRLWLPPAPRSEIETAAPGVSSPAAQSTATVATLTNRPLMGLPLPTSVFLSARGP